MMEPRGPERRRISIVLVPVILVFAASSCLGSSCGGNFSATSGELSSPGYPAPYPGNLDCVYNIHVPTTSQEHFISLHFLDYDLEESGNCSADYIDVFEGPEPSPRLRLVRLCGNHSDLRLQTGNVLGIHFHTDSENAARGFRAAWDFKERSRIAICHFGHDTLLPGTPSWVPILISVGCILIIVTMATLCIRRRLAQSRAIVLEQFPPFEGSECEKTLPDLEAPPAYEQHMAVPYCPPSYEASNNNDVPPRYESLGAVGAAAVNETESADEKLLPPPSPTETH